MTLDSIPAEILSLILDAFTSRHLKDIAMPEDGDAENIYTVWCDNRHTLKALRLVCHRIHDFASPLLFHNLSISATSDSIALANNITLRPHLVAGIRGVRLYTGLYRERIAQNRRVHEACVLSELESFLVQRATDIRRGHGRAFINKTLFQNYYRICAALRGRNIAEREMQDFIMELEGHVDTASLSTLREMMAEQGDTVNKEMQEYRGIMSQGHRDYRSNLGKQRRLLNTGEFMVALARCLARIPQLVTLEMNRSPTRPKHPRDALENKEDLRELITSRHQGFSKTPDLYRDTIFSGFMVQLPIDLYRAGVRLKTLKIDMLTTASPDDHLVTDESYRLPNHLELMANFAASVQTLESMIT
ncbi:hypothetical protein NQ176_g10035 [Zarea fungicola]|uniref:Uncharacterized protein n=1 Tax=Zarea fungicola TaxID=93591 RepID=A0ACC1MJ66_9HYPO|nr:hypothetical protein NQ176_g10035 [Lecanicillium fungicola]